MQGKERGKRGDAGEEGEERRSERGLEWRRERRRGVLTTGLEDMRANKPWKHTEQYHTTVYCCIHFGGKGEYFGGGTWPLWLVAWRRRGGWRRAERE